jgi:tetratricopeptide (TPR) repeat protein
MFMFIVISASFMCQKSHYISQELAELAMGTYKHIGRIRSARMIGRDLAAFYLQLGEMQKAAVFLADALKTFEEENWRQLAIQTHLELADCYREMNDKER